MSVADHRQTLRRYSSYGFWGGLLLGAVIAIVVGGDRFREWEDPVMSWGTLIAASAAIGAVVGFFFFRFLAPGVTSRPGSAGVGDGIGDGGGDGD